MEITWLGHSCFRIKGKETLVISDPYHPGLGYSLGKPQADIVTVSHFHPGHSYTEGISGKFKEIKGPGEYEVKNIFVLGVLTFHDNEGGRKLGKNTVYFMEIDGVILCHLGDLGHLPPIELADEIGDVGILLVPVGGVSTIDAAAALEITKRLNPKIVIPMHYKTEALVRELQSVEMFLKGFGARGITPQPKLSVSKSNLPDTTEVILLDYPRK